MKPNWDETEVKENSEPEPQEHPITPYLRMDRMPHIWCPTCGIGTVVKCYVAALENTGIDLEAFAEDVKNSLKPASNELTGKKVRIKTSVESRMIKVRNVVGVLPGKDTSEIIVIGGHYDHLGKHDGWIWNGADDNASGTVGVMTLAKA